MFTYPTVYPDISENRLVDMFHSCTEAKIKDKTIEAFTSQSSPLLVVIATTASGMGIDVPNIRTIIHFGCCEDAESYVQAVGQAGCDGQPSKAVIFRKVGKQHNSEQMKEYCENNAICLHIMNFFSRL